VRRNPSILLLTGAFLALAVSFTVFWPQKKEPEYQGKKLSEWVTAPVGANGTLEVRKAMLAMGTNCVPFLVAWVQYDPPAWRKRLFELARYLHLGPSRDTRADRAEAAWSLMTVLGPQAAGAVPALRRLTREGTTAHMRSMAMMVLRELGDTAVPALVEIAGDTNNSYRNVAVALLVTRTDLGNYRARANSVLLSSVKDADLSIAVNAILGLGFSGAHPELVIPALTNALSDSRARVRHSACMALEWVGHDARAAVPALNRALNDSDPQVRSAARGALLKIAPEVVGAGGPWPH
jgi:hypothetical protein